MANPGRIIVGLGNPGAEYEETRHNIGFRVVDALARKIGVERFDHDRGNTLTAMGRFRGRNLLLVKPLTYMNRSGSAVRTQLNLSGLEPSDLLVVYDDIALPTGRLRIRGKGSAGGHNGLQDIIDQLGSDEIPRLRFGIGDDFPRGAQARYVLLPFDREEEEAVDVSVQHAVDAALSFVMDGLHTAMNRYNKSEL
jgi:peptidyl-tRNA hydrolase, PTH1 family